MKNFQPTVQRPPLPSDIWELNGGIYLGYTVEGRTDQRRPLEGQENVPNVPRGEMLRTTWDTDGKLNLFTGDGHAAILGGQGSGKTRKILLPNLLRLHGWSAVVLDTKGALTAYTAIARQKRGQSTYVVDPTGLIKKTFPKLYAKYPEIFTSHGLNPVASLDPDSLDFTDAAKAKAEALISTEGTREIHFPQGAQALVKGLLMALRVDKPGVTDNLVALRRTVSLNAKDLAGVVGKMIDRHAKKYPAIAASLNEFAPPQFRDEAGQIRREKWESKDDRELSGIRRTAIIQTDWLDSPPMQEDLRRNSRIDFASFKQRPQTVYFVMPPNKLATFAPWLRIAMASALYPMLESIEDAKVPVLYMIDEAATLGNLEIMSKNIGQMRELGLKLMTVWQGLSQIKPIYGEAWENIMSLSSAKVVFSTGEDPATADYFPKLSGERLYKHKMKSHSSNITRGWATGTSSHWQPGKGPSFLFNGGGSNEGESGGTSFSDSTNETFQSERTVKTYELNALNADEAVIFSRRGRIEKTILPQPHIMEGIAYEMERVRADIEGRAPRPYVTLNNPTPTLVVDTSAGLAERGKKHGGAKA